MRATQDAGIELGYTPKVAPTSNNLILLYLQMLRLLVVVERLRILILLLLLKVQTLEQYKVELKALGSFKMKTI